MQRYKRHNGLTKDPEGELIFWEDHCAEIEETEEALRLSIDETKAAEAEVERLRASQNTAGRWSDKSNDAEWLRKKFLARGEEIERLEEKLEVEHGKLELSQEVNAKLEDCLRAAEAERYELCQQVEALQAKVHLCAAYDALETKLQAVEGLPTHHVIWDDFGNYYVITSSGARSGIVIYVDDLQAILKGEQP